MITYAVVGSRDFPDRAFVECVLQENVRVTDEIVSGGARGVDQWAEEWAREHGIPVTVHRPDWEQEGRSAGMRRNSTIVAAADVVLAFWDGESRGTRDTIQKTIDAGKDLRLFVHNKSD